LSPEVLAAARRLHLVHHQGVGYHDTVPVAALRERGIRLALTPEGTTVGVAEHTILLMLAVCKRLAFADAELRAGRWHVNSLRPVSRELCGMTIGYIGMGRIGQAVAERLKPFGTKGIYYDPISTLSASLETDLNLRRGAFETVLAESDIVTLHVPLTNQTRHLIDAQAISRMKPSAMIINTSRGPVIDETALSAALTSDRLAGAGLDVFETEPLPHSSPLIGLDRVVLTPHISAGTRDAFVTKMRAIFDNLMRFHHHEPLHNEVDLAGE
jgi:phosphoglycerate dehydrogenase-like enzyme